MRGSVASVSIILLGTIVAVGCADSPPPPRVAVPPPDQYRPREAPDIKPLPSQGAAVGEFPAPAFDDEPLVNQRPPEERSFVGAYEQVGRPRILVFVNRTLEGQVIPADLQIRGAVDPRDTAYLRADQYDEGTAKSLDYEAVENVLTDWLSAGGRVQIVSPTMARQRLTEEQVKDLQSGRPRMLAEVAKQLDADVLVQVQVHPTRQTEFGLEFRLIAEAINIRGGESIARAVVDLAPPLDKPRINKYTRFVARKLMDGMIQAWDSVGRPPAPGAAAPGVTVPGGTAPSDSVPSEREPVPAAGPVQPRPTPEGAVTPQIVPSTDRPEVNPVPLTQPVPR